MLGYRIYFYDTHGYISGFETFRTETDEQALARAQEAARSDLAEVWSGERMVGTIRPPPDPARDARSR